MRWIENFHDGLRVSDIYLVKARNAALTKSGREYLNVTLQDRSGTIDAKIWEPNSPGIHEFEIMDYVHVEGNVTIYNGVNQLSIQRLSVAEEGQYDPRDYLPVSGRGLKEMQQELIRYIHSLREPRLRELLETLFLKDAAFLRECTLHSAAKAVHHGYVGGLIEHTLSVASICDFYAGHYPDLNRDLLVSAALCHDIGKVRELTPFPRNDYSDEGQLLGHIVIGYEMVMRAARSIEDFPEPLLTELGHCILSHHGELAYGSPKKPALMEALALSFADNADAKLETMREALDAAEKSGKSTEGGGWIGYNRFLETNLRRTKP